MRSRSVYREAPKSPLLEISSILRARGRWTGSTHPMGAGGDSQQWWAAAGAGNAARDWHCGRIWLCRAAVGRWCRGQSKHRTSLPALGLLAAGITRGRRVITAQRPGTRNHCGQESPGGLGGECREGTVPREATLAVMPSGSWLRCSAIKIGLGSRPAGEALPVPGLAVAKQEGMQCARWGASANEPPSPARPGPSPGDTPWLLGRVWGRGDTGGLGREMEVWEVRGCGRVLPAPPSSLERALRGSGSGTALLWECPL